MYYVFPCTLHISGVDIQCGKVLYKNPYKNALWLVQTLEINKGGCDITKM